ncbi:DUF58 domain-containing protein [Leucobacter sp. USCH14]|uniref:DUF58 domain-containing protein n=1 Tax=Leucobacter sp. USCH14 TaxID=3024838 RepID=UPI0030A75622
MTLTPRGWACTVAAFALAVGWYAIGLRDIWYIAWLLAALVVVALIGAAVGGRLARFAVGVRLDEPAPFVDSTVDCTASVTHRLPGSARGRAVWSSDGRRTSMTIAFDRGAPTISVFEWTASERGPHDIGIAAIGLVDPLGLVRFDAYVAATATTLVLPRPLTGLAASLDAESASRHGDDTGAAANGTGEGTIGGGALREYRRGDASRQINWKQSARQGEWLVNLPEPATRTERALRLDCDADAYRSPADFETAVSAAAAVVVHWAQYGHVIELQLGGVLAAVSDSIDPLLRALAGARLGPGAAGESPRNASPAAHPLPAVVVSGTVHRRLRDALAASPRSGTLFTVAPVPDELPGGWRSVTIPEAS